jgi:hypothetical protein
MIRINLARKRVAAKSAPARSRRLPLGLIITVTTIVLATGGGYIGWQFVHTRTVPAPAASPPTVQSAHPSAPFKPSTYSKADIVEEVVQELADERAATDLHGTLDMTYADLSFLEKVNYEVLFARNVFTMLSRVVPSDIGLRSLEIDDFQTLYAVGMGTSRELVSSTFIRLKTEKLELLPQPFSYITSNNGDGYRFVVTCKINFGLDLTDPFQASDNLPARDDLPILTKRIVRIGDSTGVTFSGAPRQIDAERVGAYRRFHYGFKGRTTYNDFVRFLLALYDARVPCAFKKIDLKALDGSAVDVGLQLLITVRE